MRTPVTALAALLSLTTCLAAAGSPYYRFNGQARGDGAASAPSAGGNTVAPVPAFTASPATASYQPGGPVTLAPPASSGTTASTTYALLQGGSDIAGSFGSLCPGLSFSPATGRITGTPTGYCALTGLAYRADTPGQPSVVSDSFDIVVRSSYAIAAQPTGTTLRAGTRRSSTATVAGSPYGTLTWTVLGASGDASGVPSWVAKAPGSCGTSSLSCQVDVAPDATVAPGIYPAAGSFSVRAVDASGTTVTSEGFTATVQPAPVTVPQSPMTYAVTTGTPQTTAAVPPSGGTAPYAYSLQTVTGTAPAGATVDQGNGAVTFTASTVGTWTFRVRATSANDTSNYADSALFTVNATAPASVASTCAVAYDANTTSTADLGVYARKGSVVLAQYQTSATATQVDIVFPSPVSVDRIDLDIRSTTGGALKAYVLPLTERTPLGGRTVTGNWPAFDWGVRTGAYDPGMTSVSFPAITAKVWRVQWSGSTNNFGQNILESVRMYRSGQTANCP